MADLQAFVSRFSANASKARQATSRARQLEKIQLEDIQPSSRVSPFIRFEQEKPLRRIAVEATASARVSTKALVREPGPDRSRPARESPFSGRTASARPRLRAACCRRLDVDGGESSGPTTRRRGYFAQDNAPEFERHEPVRLDHAMAAARRRRTTCCARPWAACCSPEMTVKSR